jgi:hypothetical protein
MILMRYCSHGLGHRCVTQEKGGVERGVIATPGDIGVRSAVRASLGFEVCCARLGLGYDEHLLAPFGSPVCRPFLDC